MEEMNRKRNFVKEVFVAIDEDGSGTMDQDELIKALLGLGLSNDFYFSKRVIKVFSENQEKWRKSIQRRRELRGESAAAAVTGYPNEKGYHFRDFASVIAADELGKDVSKAISDEIQHKLDIKRIYSEKRKKHGSSPIERSPTTKGTREEDDKINLQVQREIMKYLEYLTTEEENTNAHNAAGSHDEEDLSPAQRAAQKRQVFAKQRSSLGLKLKLSDLSTYGRQLHDSILTGFKQRHELEEQQSRLKKMR